MDMSLNTQAILLLTAPLLVGRKRNSDVAPLPNWEYGKLAARLLEWGYEPADLLGPQASNVLAKCGHDLDTERIVTLLERGLLLTLALGRWRDCSLWVISRADPEYPKRFKMRLKQLAPPILYGCGDIHLLGNGGLAVVGSRNAGDELIEYAEKVAGLAAAAQCSIISGGARGVDSAAMRGALTEGGQVIGVLGDNLEKAALDRDNRDAVLNDQLLLISPYDPKAGFNVGNAMGRNKLMYALADAALVVESEYSKGGTWNGAVEQLDKMQLTPVYIRSEGYIGKGLAVLQGKGALEWPNPQTPEEFSLALAGEMRYTQPEPQQIPSLALIPMADEDADISSETPLDTVIAENPDTAISPADMLYAKVEGLLSEIAGSVTDSDVADYLGIDKRQAKRWLERLVVDGSYIKRNRPVRYERINTKLL